MGLEFYRGIVLTFCALLALANGIHQENEIEESKYPADLHSPASHLSGEVDLFKLLNITTKASGVSLTKGPVKGFPAYKFKPTYGNVQVANTTPVISAIDSKDGFTAVFLYRQQRNTLATLLSINSPGRVTPWFQVTSNLRTGQLIVHYRLNSKGKLHQVSWPLSNHYKKSWPLAAWTWMSLSVDYNTTTIRLDIDCMPSRFESMSDHRKGKQIQKINVPNDSLVYFRQEPGRKKKFLGSMQVAKILPYVHHQRLWTCSEITEFPKADHGKPIVS